MADDYDYIKQQQDLLYRPALAKQFANAQAPQGQMVSNWYVAPSKGAQWANALERVLGIYMGKKFNDEQAALESDDQRRADAAYEKLTGGLSQEKINSVRAANPLPQAQYTNKDPNAVGPTREQLMEVESSGVPSSNVQGTALPAMQPEVRQQLANALAARTAPAATPSVQPTPQQIERQVAPTEDLSKPFIGYRPLSRPMNQQALPPAAAAPRIVSPPQQSASPVAAPVSAVEPAAVPAPAPAAANAVAPDLTPAAAPAQDGDFNVVQPTAEEIESAQAQQGRALLAARNDQQQEGLRELARTKNGRQIVNVFRGKQLENAMVGPTLEVKEVNKKLVAYDPKKIQAGVIYDGGGKGDSAELKETYSDANGQMIGVFKDGSQRVLDTPGGAGPDAKFVNDRTKITADIAPKLETARTDLSKAQNTIDTMDSLIGDLGKYNGFGGVFGSLRGAAGNALGENETKSIQMKRDSIVAGLNKAINGGQISNADLAFVKQMVGDFSAGRVPAQESIMRLRGVVAGQRDAAQATVNTYQGLLGQSIPPAQRSFDKSKWDR